MAAGDRRMNGPGSSLVAGLKAIAKRLLCISPPPLQGAADGPPLISPHDNLQLIISDLELASKDERDRWSKERQALHDQIADLKSTIHRLQTSNAELVKQRDFLVQSMESRDKQCEALSSKMEAMERLHAQQAEAKSGSYDDAAGATPPQLRVAYDALRIAIAAFSSDLFNHYIKKLPNANEVIENVVMSGDKIESSTLNDRRKKMDRRTRAALCKLILQSLCCEALFSDYEMFPSLHASLMFQGPKEAKRALFKEHETCREMSPENLQKSNKKFSGFLQSKASMMVEKLERLLFISKARVLPPCELQGDATPCKHEGDAVSCKQQQGDTTTCPDQGGTVPCNEQGDTVPCKEQGDTVQCKEQGDTTPCEQQGLTLLPWKHQGPRIMDMSDCAVNKGFMRVIKSAWMLLNLAFSFEPTAEVLRVSMGSVFNADYMEDMMLQSAEGYGVHDEQSAHDDGHNGNDDDMVVTIMCFPGFTVRNTIIKSGVCLI